MKSTRFVSGTLVVACAGSALLGAAAGVQPLDLWLRGWPGYGHDAQHAAIAPVAAQPLDRIKWSTPVDLDPQYSGTVLYIHYGTPLVTARNTVVVTVKTGAFDGFRIEGRNAANGSLVWMQDTDYSLPAHGWVPSCGSSLTPDGGVVVPAAGGTVLRRGSADDAASTMTRLVFYGAANYKANPGAYNDNVKINTPITCDRRGDLYFGFVVTGPTPIGLQSGIARIASTGAATWAASGTHTLWVAASDAAGDPDIAQVVMNCAPALSRDGSVVYVACRYGWSAGYLLALDAATLTRVGRVALIDPNTQAPANLYDDGTASPAVGPDGDVYYGVLENPFFSNHLRGWMLHFNGALTQTKPPGAFGWDDTVSVVPADAVPSYHGGSTYLVLSKYNNYVEGGGDGVNRVAVLDPKATMADPITGTTVMREVITIAGATPDYGNIGPNTPNAVREWCINTAAVDTVTRCALVNSEDGKLYRWDFTTNTLVQATVLTPGIGEAYTPTIVGPDGTVYAINNATLFAVGH